MELLSITVVHLHYSTATRWAHFSSLIVFSPLRLTLHSLGDRRWLVIRAKTSRG